MINQRARNLVDTIIVECHVAAAVGENRLELINKVQKLLAVYKRTIRSIPRARTRNLRTRQA